MFEYEGYVGAVEYDSGVFTGRVIGLKDVVTFESDSLSGAAKAFRESVDDYLAFCGKRGETPARRAAHSRG
jgi:predicted HicB family RNase H-like nuclease